MASYRYMGFQATNLGKAVEEINRMVGRISLAALLHCARACSDRGA